MPVDYDRDAGEARTDRTLRRSGNSVVVSLPPELLREAGFQQGDKVIVAAGFGGGEITLRAPESDERTTEEATAEN